MPTQSCAPTYAAPVTHNAADLVKDLTHVSCLGWGHQAAASC